MNQERSIWGWGYAAGVSLVPPVLVNAVRLVLSSRLAKPTAAIPMPTTEKLVEVSKNLRNPRFGRGDMPPRISEICSSDGLERMSHAYGKSFEDLCRAASLDYSNPRLSYALFGAIGRVSDGLSDPQRTTSPSLATNPISSLSWFTAPKQGPIVFPMEAGAPSLAASSP